MSINIINNYGNCPLIDNTFGNITLYQDRNGNWVNKKETAEDAEIVGEELTPPSVPEKEDPLSVMPPPVYGETFIERIKAIAQRMASKNGQVIETHEKGHTGCYVYNFNADIFCRSLDALAKHEPERLNKFLGDNPFNVQVTKICLFIGNTIRMNVINDQTLSVTDVLFAFDDYYPNRITVRAKLCDKAITTESKILLGIFEGIMRKFSS